MCWLFRMGLQTSPPERGRLEPLALQNSMFITEGKVWDTSWEGVSIGDGAYHVDHAPGVPAHARHPGGVLSSDKRFDDVVVVLKKRS